MKRGIVRRDHSTGALRFGTVDQCRADGFGRSAQPCSQAIISMIVLLSLHETSYFMDLFSTC